MNDPKAAAAYHPQQPPGEPMSEKQVKYVVRYHSPLMGTYETVWGTEQTAREEAEYDHSMNGHDVEVFRVESAKIAAYTIKEKRQ